MAKEEPVQDMTQITVLIAGRPYPLKISASNEAVIHKLVNEINEKVNTLQIHYPSKDKQDCLAMAMLSMVVENYKTSQMPAPDEKLKQRMRSIEEFLDRLL